MSRKEWWLLLNCTSPPFSCYRRPLTCSSDEGNRQWVRLVARDINTKVPYPIQHYSGRLTFIMPVPLDDPDASHVDVVVHGTRVMASGSYHHHIAFGVEGIEDVDVYWLYDWESGKAFLVKFCPRWL